MEGLSSYQEPFPQTAWELKNGIESRSIHPECFQEQYKMMDWGWDCKFISNFVLLIPAKLNHQSSFLKIKRKASSKKWSELKLDKMRNVL